jgi:hypothetical protein
MDTVAVIVLNYKRPKNIQEHILPTLINNPLVSTIIIAHGLRESVFGVDHALQDEEVVRDGKVLHIGDFKANDTFCCWRRWKLIKKLKEQNILKETYIHSQDDDILFDEATISTLLQAYKEEKGIILSAQSGRKILNDKYNFTDIKGPCNIALGRSIFTKIDIICNAVEKADKLNIPTVILKEDDISLSFLSLNNIKEYKLMKHCSIKCKYKDLSETHALSSQANWFNIRNNALMYMIKLSDI